VDRLQVWEFASVRLKGWVCGVSDQPSRHSDAGSIPARSFCTARTAPINLPGMQRPKPERLLQKKLLEIYSTLLTSTADNV